MHLFSHSCTVTLRSILKHLQLNNCIYISRENSTLSLEKLLFSCSCVHEVWATRWPVVDEIEAHLKGIWCRHVTTREGGDYHREPTKLCWHRPYFSTCRFALYSIRRIRPYFSQYAKNVCRYCSALLTGCHHAQLNLTRWFKMQQHASFLINHEGRVLHHSL